MQFDNPNTQVTYIDNNDLRNYLIVNLRKTFGFEYTVFIQTNISRNELRINIDETTMSDESYQAIQTFKDIHHAPSDLDILSHFVKANEPIEIHYLIPDLEGVYIIRDRKEN